MRTPLVIGRLRLMRAVWSLALALVACSAPVAQPQASDPTVAPTPTPTAAPTPTPTAAPTARASVSPSALSFTVSGGSKATVRVREQLANLPAPNDAVLATDQVSGAFTLNLDGSFAPDSRIVVDVTSLASDSRVRDNFVKQDTLRARQFPDATFVPTRVERLPLPLPLDRDLSFTLVGDLTIRGTTKQVAFEVAARRTSAGVTATARNTPAWKFADFGLQVPRVASVLSIVDDIRLEVALVARPAAL